MMRRGQSGIGAVGVHQRRAVLVASGSCAAAIVILVLRSRIQDSTAIAALTAMSVVWGLISLFWPSLDYGLVNARMEGLVAFVGCDGSGKSTVTHDLEMSLSATMPVRVSYLGLGSGAIGERIKALPIVGAILERKLARKASQARTPGQKIPGLATALVIYLFSVVRLRRFKRMLRLRRDGFAVLTDRYPQTEFPGTYDGPGLSAGMAGSWAVSVLARQERRLYAWMTAFRPDVIVRLNVDVATAMARKPDHRPDLLVEKVKITPQLRFGGAPIVDLDATRPYSEIRSTASQIAQHAFAGVSLSEPIVTANRQPVAQAPANFSRSGPASQSFASAGARDAA